MRSEAVSERSTISGNLGRLQWVLDIEITGNAPLFVSLGPHHNEV